MVAGGKDAGHDDSVDETACGVGAGHLEDEGEGGGAGVFVLEAGAGVGDVEADDKDREEVEEKDAPEDVADYFWHHPSWVFGFAGGDGDGFGAAV